MYTVCMCLCILGLRPNTNYKFRVRLASRPRDKAEPSWPGLATVRWTRAPCAGIMTTSQLFQTRIILSVQN